MDELIKAMSDNRLRKLREEFIDNPSVVAEIEDILLRRMKVAEETRTVTQRDKLFISDANKYLGELPEYTPEWRKDKATRSISIVTVEVDDFSKPEATVGEGLRYDKMLVRQVSVGIAITMVKEKAEPTTRKRKVKDVYRLGSVPLELLIDGKERGYYTWAQIIADINENFPELLRVNGSNQPESIIETTASGLQDLRTAGFLGVER